MTALEGAATIQGMSRSLSPRFLAPLALLLLPTGLLLWGAVPSPPIPSLPAGVPNDEARLTHRAEPLWQPPSPRAQVRLPAESSSPVTLFEPRSRLHIAFHLAGARAVVASWLGGEAHYEGALGEGTELRLILRTDGVEDRIRMDYPPSREHVDYLVDVRAVAGLRKLDEVIEFLDEGGAPRLRMEAPYLEDADGRLVQAKVEVGCAYDEDPRGPWGRPVVRPGAAECRFRVGWEGQGVVYPAVLDPVWTVTGSLTDSRGNVAFGMLPSGRFLVTGGRACQGGNCLMLNSTEVYDPITETWAKVGNLPMPRDRMEAVTVPGKGLYIFGGDVGSVSSTAAELYEEATGLWKPMPSMEIARANPVAKLLPDGKTIVVLGGANISTDKALNAVEVFHTETEQWSSGGTIAQPRFWAAGEVLPSGKIFLTGGTTCDNCGPMKAAEIYDPGSKTSEVLPEMKTSRLGHGSALITVNGAQVLLAFGGGTSTTEYFDFTQNIWISAGNMADNRAFFAHVLRPDGGILVAGGGNFPFLTAIKGVERFDPKSLTWSKATSMSIPRALMGYTQLPNGKVLVAAGVSGSILISANTSNTAELFQPALIGETCQGSGDCLSGFCVDGVCCDSACTGVCEACSAAKKGSGADGSCGPVASDT
ncbi:MAG: hypothetical protein NZX77_04360, partial [Polyangiaceae bacterium]|nr:hypothetical protein [Polyangiaceae bacterium]